MTRCQKGVNGSNVTVVTVKVAMQETTLVKKNT